MNLLIESFATLLTVGRFIKHNQLNGLSRHISNASQKRTCKTAPLSELTRSLEVACALYLTRVRCLQRSATLVIMLRKRGYPADLVLGTNILTAKDHAWVEVGGTVTNDRSYVVQQFVELTRWQSEEGV